MKRNEIELLAAACWIIIATFSARRAEEINELEDDCIRGDQKSGYWLHVYIEKTLQRKEWIPAPHLVAHAVSILLSVSANARRATNIKRLFQWSTPTGEVCTLNSSNHINDFAAAVQVPLHHSKVEPGVIWHWHPHQFRRFFAILYFYRFENATIEALSHFLRHFNLEMTRRYVTQDPEAAAIWTDVEWGYMGHVARTIVAGERSIGGAAGDRLKKAAIKLIDLFRRKLQVVSPERVGASLVLMMQRQGLVLTPMPWATCSCPQTIDAAKKAACRRQQSTQIDSVGPDFSGAGPTVCAQCPHAITEGARISVVNKEVDHLERASISTSRNGTMFAELERARVIELRQVRDLQYLRSTPLASSGNH